MCRFEHTVLSPLQFLHAATPGETSMSESSMSLRLLLWFKHFFDASSGGERDTPVAQAQSFPPCLSKKGTFHNKAFYCCLNVSFNFSYYFFLAGDPPTSHQSSAIMKVEDDTAKKPRLNNSEDPQNSQTDVVIISDEDEREVEVGEHSVELKLAGIAAQNGLHDSNTLSAFITQYSREYLDIPPPVCNTVLSRDTVQACSTTPYSLYLYVGVHLDGGQRTSVVLVGYVDLSSGLSVVKLLDTLQLSTDSVDVDPNAAAGAAADACLLIDRLKTRGLSLGHLCVFYCNAHLAVSRVFELQLQAFSPRLVSLCGLPGLAGRACQAGLLRAFPCVLNIIRELHHQRSNWAEVDDALKDIFTVPYSPSQSICAQALSIVDIVEKMSNSWRDIKENLMLLDVNHTKELLMDDKLELYFLFLSKALRPLRALQVMQGTAAVNVAEELQLILILLRSYADSILHPSASSRFLRKWDLGILQDKENLLPTCDVDIGASARDFLGGASSTALTDQDQNDFFNSATTFYKAVLESLVQNIPTNLSKAALMTVTKVLKYPEDIYVSDGRICKPYVTNA